MVEAADGRTAGSDARERIMSAAEELAVERGPSKMSIEAVAVRAGLSKGGVLYHFRTKADLLSALVCRHVQASKDVLEANLAGAEGAKALVAALIEAHRAKQRDPTPPPTGVLAAIAEHPAFLDPLRTHQRAIVARLKCDCSDPELVLMLFLALEGMKAMHLFGLDALDPELEDDVLRRMAQLLEAEKAEGLAREQ